MRRELLLLVGYDAKNTVVLQLEEWSENTDHDMKSTLQS